MTKSVDLILTITSITTSSVIIIFMTYAVLITLLGLMKSKEFSSTSLRGLPEVSILIPVKDEAEVLKEALKSLLSINYPLSKLRVYVGVDVGCSKCLDVCRSFNDELIIECVEVYGSKPLVLNKLLRRVSSDYVLLIDCDTILSSNILTEFLKVLGVDGVVGVTGVPKPNNLCSGLLPKYFLVECRLWRSITKAKDSLGLIVQAPGYCSLLKREFIELVGGWEDLLTEDNDLTLRIYGVGGRIKLVGAEVYIESPTKVLTLIKQRVRWYRGTLEVLIRRWGVLSRLGLKLRIDAFMTYTSPITPALLIPALISNTLLGGPFNLINAILVIPQVLTPLMISDLDIISRIKLSIITLPYVIINSIASIIAITTLVLGIRISWWRTEKLGVRCFIN